LSLAVPAFAKDKSNEGFFHIIKEVDADRLNRIRQLLLSIETDCTELVGKCEAGIELRDTLVDGDASRHLPMLFVYLDKNLEVKTNRLVWRNLATPFVIGAQNVWVVVISEHPVDLEANTTLLWGEKASMTPGTQDVFISEGKRALESEEGRVMGKPLALETLAGSGVDDELFIGIGRFAIRMGGAYRIKIVPSTESARQQAQFQSVHASFSNSTNSSIDFGIGAGFTFDTGDLTESPGTGNDINGIQGENYVLSAYWMLQIYLRKPMLLEPIANKTGSRYRTSYAVTVGFNLNIFDLEQFILGFNIGHLFGRNGVVIGANFTDLDNSDAGNEIYPFFGVNFNF
jgi:hypothetical protein